MKIERKTTWASVWRERAHEPDDPQTPDDEHDWILEAMAADNGFIYWSWARWLDEGPDGKG